MGEKSEPVLRLSKLKKRTKSLLKKAIAIYLKDQSPCIIEKAFKEKCIPLYLSKRMVDIDYSTANFVSNLKVRFALSNAYRENFITLMKILDADILNKDDVSFQKTEEIRIEFLSSLGLINDEFFSLFSNNQILNEGEDKPINFMKNNISKDNQKLNDIFVTYEQLATNFNKLIIINELIEKLEIDKSVRI